MFNNKIKKIQKLKIFVFKTYNLKEILICLKMQG